MEEARIMQTESLGKMLPRILFPYVQQWAERSGMTLLSRLLVDDQFRGLLEKYGDEMMRGVMQAGFPPGNAPQQGNDPVAPPSPGATDNSMNGSSLAKLQERVMAMEAQETVLSILRNRARPLALALGCCPECLVGLDGCPKCWGQSRIAYFPPDVSLLEAQIVNPLSVRGVPLRLNKRDRAHERKSNGVRRRRSHA
jgi:hypothetical protein